MSELAVTSPVLYEAAGGASGPYVGRFAPSPTGVLHFGSLVTAVAGFMDARQHNGQWLLRIDDLDHFRNRPGVADDILRTLERYGMYWDGEIVWQSHCLPYYQQVFDRLRLRGLVYPCGCTRQDSCGAPRAADGSHRYSGCCRNGLPAGKKIRTWRLRVEGSICFTDRIQGMQQENLPGETGDYVVLRADGVFAYQLAVVVDDALAGITRIVRGADLLPVTARQIFLQRLLGGLTPEYTHIPVAVNAQCEKLSKQTLAPPVAEMPVSATLCEALCFLGQSVPAGLYRAPVAEIWHWAIAHGSLRSVPNVGSRYWPAHKVD